MTRETLPEHDARGLAFAVVAARFNETYVRRMVDAALAVLRARGASEADLEVWWVPGSFELPLAARWAIERRRVAAVLAFGVLIRGETEHYRLVAESSTEGLMRVMLDEGVPVLDGVLAVENAEQAAARTGGAAGNRGADVALAAIAMARLAADARAEP